MSDTDSTIDTTEAKAGSSEASTKPKTAVVVVHGMGEQRPMDTLWGLVEALWIQDRTVGADKQVYPKPDRITGSFELRRITTVKSRLPQGKRVDFFEFYWAHLMRDNKTRATVGAIQALLWRPPGRVPRPLLSVWLFGNIVFVTLLALYGAALAATSWTWFRQGDPPWWWFLVLAGATAILFLFRAFARRWLGPVAGDAARYLSPDPGNVAARQSIREAAVNLIEALHRSPDYDRIIVIGHSLGTIVAYDALAFAWGRIDHPELEAAHSRSAAAGTALGELEKAADDLNTAAARGQLGPCRAAYRAAQRAYLAELSKLERSPGQALWRVSDFISTASPLSKADVLMAADPDGWRKRCELRDVPTCPPQFEPETSGFSYATGSSAPVPHHAAVFGPTVWTNVYFETQLIVLGDVIAGPVRKLFGPGALDVRIKRGSQLVRHLDYWKKPETAGKDGKPHPWIRALRRAVNLPGAPESTAWGGQATAEEVIAEQL